MIGFKSPLIHCYNKNAKVIPKNASFLSEISNRSNVLLLGDNSGDASLDLGLVNPNANVLRIGFFNRQVSSDICFCTSVLALDGESCSFGS